MDRRVQFVVAIIIILLFSLNCCAQCETITRDSCKRVCLPENVFYDLHQNKIIVDQIKIITPVLKSQIDSLTKVNHALYSNLSKEIYTKKEIIKLKEQKNNLCIETVTFLEIENKELRRQINKKQSAIRKRNIKITSLIAFTLILIVK